MPATRTAGEDQIKKAILQLYESEGLTDALTDEPATLLLGWGEQQLKNSSQLDQAEFESAAYQTRRIIGSINRLVERQADMAEKELVQRLIQLVERAMKLPAGEPTSPDQGASDDEAT